VRHSLRALPLKLRVFVIGGSVPCVGITTTHEIMGRQRAYRRRVTSQSAIPTHPHGPAPLRQLPELGAGEHGGAVFRYVETGVVVQQRAPHHHYRVRQKGPFVAITAAATTAAIGSASIGSSISVVVSSYSVVNPSSCSCTSAAAAARPAAFRVYRAAADAHVLGVVVSIQQELRPRGPNVRGDPRVSGAAPDPH